MTFSITLASVCNVMVEKRSRPPLPANSGTVMELRAECKEAAGKGEKRGADPACLAWTAARVRKGKEAPVVKFREEDSFGFGHGMRWLAGQAVIHEDSAGCGHMGTAEGSDRGW